MNSKPTVEQVMRKLDADPQAAREFDAHAANEAPGMTRRQAVELTLKALRCKSGARDASASATTLKQKAKQAEKELEKSRGGFVRTPSRPAPAPTPTPAKPSARRRDNSPETQSTRDAVRRALAPAKLPTKAPASAPQENRPFADAATDHLVAAIRRKYITGTEAQAAAEELVRRGVVMHKTGYSISKN